MRKACIVLEDGEIFWGKSFGKEGEVFGEVVFNTSLTGYQEILTDPSYAGQLVTLTYPLIGNYGINDEDMESIKPKARALIIKKLARNYSNFRANRSLDDFLTEHGIIGIEDVDTRRLTLHIREKGAMRAMIKTFTTNDDNIDLDDLKKQVLVSPKITEEDLVSTVTTKEKYIWDQNGDKSSSWPETKLDNSLNSGYNVAVIDFGVKTNILRLLRTYFKNVTVYPAYTQPNEILNDNPDGIFLSNGPGDPLMVESGIESVKNLLGKKPIFGICLGHQILSLALGAKTYKLKFGHRGGNQPVQAIHRKNIEITSQNHGFAVDEKSLSGLKYNIIPTHKNLNDETNEGIKVAEAHAFSVQYHPEAAPGPHDSRYLFEDFVKIIKQAKSSN